MTKHSIFCHLLGHLGSIYLLLREVTESELVCAEFVLVKRNQTSNMGEIISAPNGFLRKRKKLVLG